MTPIEQYAITMLCDGATSTIEDDLNEDGQLNDLDHHAAVDLALSLATAIRNNPTHILNLINPPHGEISITGYSDDIISVTGSVEEEWQYGANNNDDDPGDLITASDGTTLRIHFTNDGNDGVWRITPIRRGTGTLTITQWAAGDQGYSDTATITGLTTPVTVVHGAAYATGGKW